MQKGSRPTCRGIAVETDRIAKGKLACGQITGKPMPVKMRTRQESLFSLDTFQVIEYLVIHTVLMDSYMEGHGSCCLEGGRVND
jgi:hypothetical protein